jgi:hypothetical protein
MRAFLDQFQLLETVFTTFCGSKVQCSEHITDSECNACDVGMEQNFCGWFLADIVPCSSPPQRLCFFNKFEPPYIAVSDKLFSVLVQVWRDMGYSSLEVFLMGFWEGFFLGCRETRDLNNLLNLLLWTWQNSNIGTNEGCNRSMEKALVDTGQDHCNVSCTGSLLSSC